MYFVFILLLQLKPESRNVWCSKVAGFTNYLVLCNMKIGLIMSRKKTIDYYIIIFKLF